MAPAEIVPSHAMKTTHELQMTDQSVWSVQSLCDKGIKEVPKEYINPLRKNYDTFPLTDEEIPVIDYANIQAGSDEELAKFVDACKNWGFFQLANHGISEDLVVKTTHVAKQFFYLSPEDKKPYTSSDPSRPAFGYGRLNYLDDEGVPDWADALSFYVDSNFGISMWPEKPEQYRETFMQYSKEIKILGSNLLNVVTRSLGLPENYVNNNIGEGVLELGTNFYPRCPEPDLVFGVSPHSDPQYITLLLQDMEGLHVLRDERWILAKPRHNHFVVNLGDQIQVLSNGKYKSALHRAVVNNEKDRLSLTASISPCMNTVVGPAPQFIDEAHPPKYKAKSYVEFLGNSLAHGFLGKGSLVSSEL